MGLLQVLLDVQVEFAEVGDEGVELYEEMVDLVYLAGRYKPPKDWIFGTFHV
jgi:hypothetical protein